MVKTTAPSGASTQRCRAFSPSCEPLVASLSVGIRVLFTFVLMTLALATASVFTRRDRPSVGGRARAARWSIAGLGLLTAVVLVTPLRQELAAPAVLILFVPVALLLGAAPVRLTEAVRRALPVARTTAARVGYRLLAAPAIIASLLLPLMIVVGILQLSGVILYRRSDAPPDAVRSMIRDALARRGIQAEDDRRDVRRRWSPAR